MAPKRDVPLVKYDEKAVAALNACREYLKEAQEFLDGYRKELPDPSGIAVARFPQSSILNARHTGADRFERKLPFIAAVVEDQKQPERQRSERYIDPWYFLVMLLLELPGGRFYFNVSKLKYHYLHYVGPGREGDHTLRRIILDTPSRSDTREIRAEDGHYDYRRVTLKPTSKKAIQAMGQETHKVSRTREHAIKFAIALFERQLNGRDKLPELGLDRDEYQRLLRTAFEVADKMHEKSLDQAAERDGGKAAAV